MSDDTGRPGGTGDGDEVGSVAEEAAKLLGALSGWAKTHGGDLGNGLSDIASAALHDVDEHIATGAPECRYCPVCRVVHVVRDVSPEVRTHLMMAGANLMQAAAALMATAVQDDKDRASGGVERIDLDDEWPEDEMSFTIGVDIGGTKIAAGLVDEDGSVVEQAKVDSPATDTDAIAAAVEDVVRRLREGHDVDAVGVSAAGFVDARRASVMFAPNVSWRDVDLKGDLEKRTGLPVVVENDGNAAAWGEFAFGAAQDLSDDLLLVTVGTGVGGGVVMDGHLYRGTFGVAGEVGHIRIERNGRLCGCGLHGCLEQYGSGTALVSDTRAAVRADADGAAALLNQAGGDVDRITGPMITVAAQSGDTFAQERLAVLGGWLGEGIASLVAVLDPGVIVIGGGVSVAGDLLLDPVRRTLEENLTGRGHRPVADVRAATLGNDAGMIGAAHLARP